MEPYMIDYSVIIRTTGKAGEKYATLLDSISKLEPRPQEVIVVLPEGHEDPAERLGWEHIFRCPKGMVSQRMFGIAQCRTRYALITDDDIAFESDFVQKLAEPLVSGGYGLSAGPLLAFFPQRGFPAVLDALKGSAIPTVFHKDRYNTVLNTTGYSYNRNIDVGTERLYETQSAPWTCFFADVEKLRGISFEKEIWLDKNGYSAHDDTAMFYKAWLNGIKTVIVAGAPYQHLDAKTSTRGNKKVAYASGFNTVVFWHRFLFTQSHGAMQGFWSWLCIRYHIFASNVFNYANCLRKHIPMEEGKAYADGARDGWKYLKSEEYRSLPPVRK